MQFSKNCGGSEKSRKKNRNVSGFEVHAHVHLIPLNDMDEMRFKIKVDSG
jgi:diadenosine tetraphosphate (Ap4A) HIT family hydrolase